MVGPEHNDDELHELLSLIDQPVGDVPPVFETALLNSLRETLGPDPDDSFVAGEPTEETGAAEVVPLSPTGARPPRRLSLLAAAAVLIVLLGLGALVANRSRTIQNEIATDNRAAIACAQFERELSMSGVELEEQVDDDSVSVAGKIAAIDEVIDSLTTLREALGGNTTISERDLLVLRNMVGGLQQARTELELGELDRAVISLNSSLSSAASISATSPLSACLEPIL